MTDTPTHVFLAGASRGVGLEIAKQLVAQKVKVTALLRSQTSRTELESLGIRVVFADALDAPALTEQVVTHAPYDAVISTMGGMPQGGERSDYLGNKNLIDAALAANVQRFLLVTSIGTGDSIGALSPQVLEVLGAVLIEKGKAEEHLRASGMTYTIIRPGGLKSEPATGQAILTGDTQVAGMIHRPDVATLVCRCLGSAAAANQVLSAVDPSLVPIAPNVEIFTA